MKLPVLVTAVALTSLAAPAQAAVIIGGGGTTATFNGLPGDNTIEVLFNGIGGDPKAVVSGLSGLLTLTLDSIDGNTFNFSYDFENTSTLVGTFISGFGFDVDPNVTSASATGQFPLTDIDGPNNFASFAAEVCFNGGPGTCPNGQPATSIGVGETGSGTFALVFGSPQTSITLSNGLDRYQGFTGTNANGQTVTSAIGQPIIRPRSNPPPAIPEPATWAMMLLGFGAVGAAMRRNRARTHARISFA